MTLMAVVRPLVAPVLRRTLGQQQQQHIFLCACTTLPTLPTTRTFQTPTTTTYHGGQQVRFKNTYGRRSVETYLGQVPFENKHEDVSDDLVATEEDYFLESSPKPFSRIRSVKWEKEGILTDLLNPSHAVRRVKQLHKGQHPKVGEILDEVIKGLLKQQRRDAALVVVEELVEKGEVEVPRETYMRLLKSLLSRQREKRAGYVSVGAGHQFLTLVVSMSERGYTTTSDVEVTLLVLKMAALIGDEKLAQCCFDELVNSHIPNIYDSRITNEQTIVKKGSKKPMKDNKKEYLELLFEAHIASGRKKKTYRNSDDVLRVFNDLVQHNQGDASPQHVKQMVENLVKGNRCEEVRVVVKGLKKDRDNYLKYLDVLEGMRPYLVKGQENAALFKYARDSEFYKDAVRFAALFR